MLVGALAASAQDPGLRFGGQIPPEVDTTYERALTWLAAEQNPDGGWKGNYEGSGVNGICLMAFLASGEDPNYGKHAATIRRALRGIITSQEEKTGYLPNSMYHHGFATLALSEAYGMVDETLLWEGKPPVRSIGQTLKLAIRCAGEFAKAKYLRRLALSAGCFGCGYFRDRRDAHGAARRAQCRHGGAGRCDQ